MLDKIDETSKKDAIHVAIYPAVAGCKLNRGEHVGKLSSGRFGPCDVNVGVVNPFTDQLTITEGEMFWLLLYPGTVTSLRHDWNHPSIDGGTNRLASIEWLKEFAFRCGADYEWVMKVGENALSGSALCGDDHAQEVFEEEKLQFIIHFFVVTGKKIPDDVWFSCAC